MKYVKMLGLIVVAAAALMALSGTAAASQVTSPPGTTYTGSITAESEGYSTLHNAVGTISCNSTLSGNVDQHGAGPTAGGVFLSVTFTGCTNGSVHTTIVGGRFQIHPLGNGRGRITKTIKFTLTMFGVECGYSGNEIDAGEITSGTHGTIDIKASIPRTHGSFFCGSAGNWTAAYKITSPTNIAFS